MYGGQQKYVQDFGGKRYRKETISRPMRRWEGILGWMWQK